MGDGIERNRPRDRVEGGLPEAGKNFGFHFWRLLGRVWLMDRARNNHCHFFILLNHAEATNREPEPLLCH